MKLSHFNKLHEDEHTATLRHPDGHHIVVAKNGLSQSLKEHLDSLPIKMDEGGDVPEDQLQYPDLSKMQENAANLMEHPDLSVEEEDQSPVDEYAFNPTDMITPGFVTKPAEISQKQQEKKQEFTPPKEETRDPSSVPQVPANYPAPQQPKTQESPMGNVYGQSGDQYQKAIAEHQQGTKEEANAIQKQGELQYAVQAEAIKKRQEFQETYDNQYKSLYEQNQKWVDDLNNGHVDPNRFINNMGFGDKVLSSIGMLLGGIQTIGSGPRANASLEFIKDQINKDIESQKMDLGKKENLLTANLRLMGNMRDAMELTRLNMSDVVNAKMQQAAAQSMGPMAQARAKQLDSEFKMKEAIPAMQQMALRRTMMSQMSGGSATMPYGVVGNPPMDMKEMQERYVPGVGLAATSKDAEKVIDYKVKTQPFNDLLEKSIKFQQTHSPLNLTPADRIYAKALGTEIQNEYRVAHSMGVYKESEAEFAKGVNPDSLLDFTAGPKLRALKETADQHKASTLRAHGFNVPQVSQNKNPPQNYKR